VQGIYQIVNTVNGKQYIGSSRNIKRRWRGRWMGLVPAGRARVTVKTDILPLSLHLVACSGIIPRKSATGLLVPTEYAEPGFGAANV